MSESHARVSLLRSKYIYIKHHINHLFSYHEFLHFVKMYSATDLRAYSLCVIKEAYFSRIASTKNTSLPANVNTSVAKRKTRRGPGPRGTRVGSICSRTAAPRATPASVARVPRLVTGRCTPLELALPFSISFSPSPWTSSRCGRPRPSASKLHDESTHAENHPRPFFPTPWMLRIPDLIIYMPFLRLANNRIPAFC